MTLMYVNRIYTEKMKDNGLVPRVVRGIKKDLDNIIEYMVS